MARQIQYTCDVCGAPKGATNHWFIILRSTEQITISQWDNGISDPSARHVCGQACAAVCLSEQFDWWKRKEEGNHAETGNYTPAADRAVLR